MLVLDVADYNATRWMGPVLAIGTAVTVLAGRHAAARRARGRCGSARSRQAARVGASGRASARSSRRAPGGARRRRARRARRRRARQPRAISGTLDFSEQFREHAGVRRRACAAAGEVPARPGRAGRRARRRAGASPTRCRARAARRSSRLDLVGSRATASLALVRITLEPGPVHREAAADTIPRSARDRAAGSSPDGARRRPDGRDATTPRRRSPRDAQADRPARARARVPDRRRAAALADRADLRDRAP